MTISSEPVRGLGLQVLTDFEVERFRDLEVWPAIDALVGEEFVYKAPVGSDFKLSRKTPNLPVPTRYTVQTYVDYDYGEDGMRDDPPRTVLSRVLIEYSSGVLTDEVIHTIGEEGMEEIEDKQEDDDDNFMAWHVNDFYFGEGVESVLTVRKAIELQDSDGNAVWASDDIDHEDVCPEEDRGPLNRDEQTIFDTVLEVSEGLITFSDVDLVRGALVYLNAPASLFGTSGSIR